MAFPTTSVLDSFNAGASQALTSRSGWGAGFPFPGEATFTTDGTPTTAVSTASSGNLWGTNFTDVEVWITLGAAGQVEYDLYARWSGSVSRNGYSLIWLQSGSQFYLVSVAAGANTTISSVATQAMSAGDSMGIAVIGTSVAGWYKAAAGSWTMLVSATDSTYAGSGAIGLDSFSASNTIDSFGGGAPVAAPTQAGVNFLTGDNWGTVYA
jgi:hypothetical protein